MRFANSKAGFAVVLTLISLTACAPPEGSVDSREEAGTPGEVAPNESTGAFEGLAVHAQRARAAIAQEDWETTRNEYAKALAGVPGHPVVLFRLARAEARLGEADSAIEHLSRMAELGATADVEADENFASLVDSEDFQVVAAELKDNGKPQTPAELVKTFEDAELWPEGIATDAATGEIYVGSFHRNKIVRISTDGSIEDVGSMADDNLQSVVGIWVDSDRRELWAATGDPATPGAPLTPGEVVRYNIESGELVARYLGPDDGSPQLINDVTVAPDGTAYITESLRGRIFRIKPDSTELELYKNFPLLGFVNGIAVSPDGSTLYFAHLEGLSAIDLVTGDTQQVVADDGSVLSMGDGLSWAGDGLVIVQNQPRLNNRVVHVVLDETGRRAVEVTVLPSGVPEGLLPYTSAVHDGSVYVVATGDFALLAQGEVPAAPAVVRMSL